MRRDVKMCQMTVIGIGRSNDEKRTMAIVLRERNGAQRYMPVLVPPHRERSYVVSIRHFTRSGTTDHDVVDALATAVGYRIRKVVIYLSSSGLVLTEMCALSDMGEEVRFTVPMHQGIVHAYLRNLPIFVEDIILDTTDATVRIESGYREVEIDLEKERIQNSIVGQYISNGVRPEDIDHDTALLLSEITTADLTGLYTLSLEGEQYEWSRVLFEEQKRRESYEE